MYRQLLQKSIYILFLAIPAFLTSCNKKRDNTSLEYLLVKFQGDENWSLMNEKGEVVKRNELESYATPSMVTDGIFIAERGYYKVNDLKNPAFTDKKFIAGTEFNDGVAVAVNENDRFILIDTDGEEVDGILLSADDYARKPEHGFFYAKNHGKEVVSSIKGILDNPNGNVILGPDLTGSLFYKRDKRGFMNYSDKTYRAYRGASNKVETVWETHDNLINFNTCSKMGYLIKRTKDGHAVFLDLDLKELFSHPDVYTSEHRYNSSVAYLGDKVIYQDGPDSWSYGVMKTDGTVLLKPEYSDITYLADGIFIAKKAGEDYGCMIRENGELVIDEPIDFEATKTIARSLKPKLGKYFILRNNNHEVIFVDGKGNKLELPEKLINGLLGDADVWAWKRAKHNAYFRNIE